MENVEDIVSILAGMRSEGAWFRWRCQQPYIYMPYVHLRRILEFGLVLCVRFVTSCV